MKKAISVILVLLIIAAVAFVGFKMINKCDSCGETFFGAGYEANIISDTLKDDDQTICKECAESQHIIELGLGTKTLDDFKKDIFE